MQNQMNQVMGVRQRDQADRQLYNGIKHAERWLHRLGEARDHHGSQRDKWRRELQQWAASRGLSLAQVVDLIGEATSP
ncbi:hypothetical protein AB0H37_42910 [Actinomadura sp. NPDC023710]|uniref:hypothetical protein n=1 Tax=Actinomadura sp. NPDC023710 TaxID=3158219 RepID=UPI0033D55F81